MSIYDAIFNLIQSNIFGGALTQTQQLCVELYSLGATFFLISLPFVVVAFTITTVFKLLRW